MRYWLLKSEPDVFSLEDLKNCPNQTEPWDGIRNYQARNLMRDEMKVGDQAFFYHSRQAEPAIVGTVRIVREAYPDHTSWDPSSKYFDEKSSAENPRWLMMD
ncbi:MAG: EVE domain-containing protein, partial [SAR324 cluster bacterium]|nr:EVE domain-containing protein [SAR324 cluster bacterium]